ncbi:hypothetical protein [Clostridium butyricum]|uniref:hypothetical protein n=2 Tax=Clostridium butyricum TaxID=1492 RepID=UPI002AB2D250|nr:hypothetical protein [Clostridium butyricum]
MIVIEMKLNIVKKIIFENSIKKFLNIEMLVKLYGLLLKLKEEFFELSFDCYNGTEELEQVRKDLMEQIINVKILIKEERGLDYTEEIYKMKKLFDLND